MGKALLSASSTRSGARKSMPGSAWALSAFSADTLSSAEPTPWPQTSST